ncbi:MAG TPA: ATP-binding protein [Verrucomicrobiae bacterium]|nr:ATP-binding protein [Verrucomicrobiae bacterium]
MKGAAFLNTRIGRRFVAIFLAISLVPLLTAGWFALRSSETAVRQQTQSVLRAAADGAEAQLREFLKHLQEQTVGISEDKKIREILQSSAGQRGNNGASSAVSDLSGLLARLQEIESDTEEIFILGTNGQVIASSVRSNIGTEFSSCEFFQQGGRKFFPGDVSTNTDGGRLTWIMSAPIKDVSPGHVLGVVALRVNPRTLSDLTSGRRIIAEGGGTQSFRIGDTGETYIVNRDGLMITESRYNTNSMLKVKVDTTPVRTALERGEEIVADYIDYRGMQVRGASAVLRDMGWVLITEIDFAQAFAPIRRFQRGLLELTAGLGLTLVLLAWASARRIVLPIQMLAESDRALASGDENAAVVSEKELPDDELGELVRMRNVRVKALLEASKALDERTAKLRDAVGELDKISYSMIHDMRAPLRAISNFGSMVMENELERLSPESREYLARMKGAALRMDRLLCDVLHYNGIVRSDVPLNPVNTTALLHEIVQTYPVLQNAKISLPAELPAVQGNEALLTQCFSNLLVNAVKFVRPGNVPEVRVTAERTAGDRVRISIEDNGIGIAPEFHERVFGIFERGSASEEGTGIGLAIVRKAVERMRGRVGLISERGQGSRFWVELNAAD